MQRNGLSPDYTFLEEVEAAGPFCVSECFQCRKCTNGCPATFAMDLYPDQVIRLAILGMKDEVLRSNTIWVCASCETCSTRCPNGVRIAEIMDFFREMAVVEGVAVPQPQVVSFHQTFLDNIRYTGRIFEGGLLGAYMLRSGQMGSMVKTGAWKDQVQLGWKMFRKGRLPLLPKSIEGKAEVAAILRPSK
jgi:heterodisulfide reductase subunit C